MSDDILPAGMAHRLLAEGQARWEQGKFHDARIGPTLARKRDTSIRGDAICWLEPHDPQRASIEFQSWAAQLQAHLNQYFYLGLKRLECHFARYGSGAGYATHIDQHKGTPFRKISLVLYLNPAWMPEDGGELALYATHDHEHEIARVLPTMGRLALFRSDITPHAVLPCRQTRWSIAGWFRTDAVP